LALPHNTGLSLPIVASESFQLGETRKVLFDESGSTGADTRSTVVKDEESSIGIEEHRDRI
jgi:hypothetical protein